MKSVFTIAHLDLVNESGNHAVPQGSETHFKLLLVTRDFEGKTLVQRHRMVYGLVEDEMKDGLHALALQTYTPEEWMAYQSERKSPPCLGGSKNEKK